MAHKILIIDDERTSVALLKFSLSSVRYDVIVAHDGSEGLEQVANAAPDLIILDVFMPKMDGYGFMCELKNQQGFETTPVIMLTSNETMQDVFKLEGVKGYFVKPLDLPQLIVKIVEILGPNPG